MKKLGIALAVIAGLTMGVLSTADAQGKGRRDGMHAQRHQFAQHRASPRKFHHGVDRRHARQHAGMRHGWKRGHDRPRKHIWGMKHGRHAWKRGFRKHHRFHRRFRRPHRRHGHVHRVYPVYGSYPIYSHGLEIETGEFRFKVYGSD